VGNLPEGRRLHQLTSPGRYRALTALLLLSPGTPLIFQGQEFAASSPFLFFADHEPELARLVYDGRQNEMRSFTRGEPLPEEYFASPADPRTFERSKLDLAERERHREIYQMHRDLLRLRREDAVFASQRADRIHGAVVADQAFLLRFLGENGDDRLVLVNLGREVAWSPVAEPLAAPPAGRSWQMLWSSEEFQYGALGTPPLDVRQWIVPGEAALVLSAQVD
jgi:maltooligosyltrehalose trehalohydrolase